MGLMAVSLLAAAIPLGGVSGGRVWVQAELDGCNVRLGDPMSVTVSFLAPEGYDFKSLRPPSLADGVDETVWRLDKESARTQTLYSIPQDESTAYGRTFTYGIRPLQEGLIEFPALSFSYENAAQGTPVTIATRPIPVHVRPAVEVALAETESPERERPMPDGLLVDLSGSPWGSGGKLNDDELFAWRKACANPTAEAFAAFAIPEARLNEAACEILSDNWARALKIYGSLEWQIGQVPAIERGMVAALAVKFQNPEVELPVWRQVLRPVLRFALWGRIACILSLAVLTGCLVWGVRRIIRALACLAVLFLPLACLGVGFMDPFQIQMSGFGDQPNMPDPDIRAKASVASEAQRTGEAFEMILEVSMDPTCALQSLEVRQPADGAIAVAGPAQSLSSGGAASGERRTERYSVPIRCNAPFDGTVSFDVVGQVRQQSETKGAHGFSSFSMSRPYGVATQSIALKVAGEPPAGVAGEASDSFVARASVSGAEQLVGRPFEVVYELETPKDCAVEEMSVNLPQGCRFVGRGVPLPDGEASDRDRVLHRFAFPVRFDVPFDGDLQFEVVGQTPAERHRYAHGTGRGYMTYPKPFSVPTLPVSVAVREPEVKAGVSVLSTNVVVSQAFDLEIRLVVPADLTVEGMRLDAADAPGFRYGGSSSRSTSRPVDGNPRSVECRLVVPVQFDVPFKGPLAFGVSGSLVGRVRYSSSANRDWPRHFVRRFSVTAPAVAIDVGVPEQERPADFSGAVGDAFRLTQTADRTEVSTNDVVTLSCRLDYRGFLPADLDLGGITVSDRFGRKWMTFKRYCVADGSPKTEDLTLCYYDVSRREYVTARAPGVALTYVPEDARTEDRVVVNAGEGAARELVPLLFAPAEGAAEIGKVDPADEALVVTETSGPWARVDDGRRAGWVKQEDLP